MNKKRYLVSLGLLFTLCGCFRNDELILKNDNYLVLSDSIAIPVDSLTITNSNSFSFKDSMLIIPNEGLNTLSLVNIGNSKNYYYNFSFLGKGITMDAAWISSRDSFFIYSKKKYMVYLLNTKLTILDSFSLKRSLPTTEKIAGPAINVSTSQQPFFINKKIYYSGISIGENMSQISRFTLGEIEKDTIRYYVNFPKDYAKKNLGGLYYRITYHTVVDDSLIYISFPASDEIAIFNINNKSVIYKNIYPNISNRISTFNYDDKEVLSGDQSKIAKHFYGQYSFKEIIYDPYHKVFYRFLLLPGKEDDIEKKIFGKQHCYLLVYDKRLNYLGCKLIGLNVKHGKFFINKKGIFLLKNSKDESTLYFYLYIINDSRK